MDVKVTVADGSGECVAVIVMVAEGVMVLVEVLVGVISGGAGAQAVIGKSINARAKHKRLTISLPNQCMNCIYLHIT